MRFYVDTEWQQPGWHSGNTFVSSPVELHIGMLVDLPRRWTAPSLSRVSIERKDEGKFTKFRFWELLSLEFENAISKNMLCLDCALYSLSWLHLNQREKVPFSRWETGNGIIWPSFPKQVIPSSFVRSFFMSELVIKACTEWTGLSWMFLSFLNLLNDFSSCPLCNLSPRNWVLKPSSGTAPMGIPSTSTTVCTHFHVTLSRQKMGPLRLRLCHSEAFNLKLTSKEGCPTFWSTSELLVIPHSCQVLMIVPRLLPS